MSPYPLLLILYPLVATAAPIVFHTLWPHRSRLTDPLGPGEKAEVEMASHEAAQIWLFTYGSLMFGTLLWWLCFPTGLDDADFFFKSKLSDALIGGYLGVAWAGISIWLLALGAATGRMRREIPGMLAPLNIQVAVWLVGSLVEEAWRATAVAGPPTNRYSAFSVIVVGLVYGSGHLVMGGQRAAAATLDGIFFGFLLLWRGSFLAPFAARLAVQAVYLWGVGQMSQDPRGRRTWQIPGTQCPVCQTRLGLLQIKLGEVFQCPSCKERLSLSDFYQNVMRFAAAFGFFSSIVITLALLTSWLPGDLGAWLTYPVSYGIATSCLFLYRKAFVRLFPPRLQRGTPHIITLGLDDRPESKPENDE